MDNLYINGQEISPSRVTMDELSGERVIIEIPNHLVIDQKNAEKWIGDLNSDDCEKLYEVLRIDTDKFQDKKCKIIIQVIGNKSR